MRSSQSGPAGAYVDLLDAHAGLYPTDFRQRVLATGARDFGEDVADRNLGKNASYTHLMEDPVRTSSRTSSQRPTSSALSAVKDSDGGAVFKSSKRYSLGSNLRTNSTVSDTGAAAPKPKRFPTDRELPLPKGRIRIDEDGSEGVAKPIKAVWRKSMPSSMSELHMRRDQDDGSDFPEALRVKSKAVFSVSRQEVNARQSVSPTGDPRHDRTYVSELSRYDDGNLDSNDPQEPVSKEVKTARRRTLNHTREPLTDQMDPKRLSLQNLQVLTSRLEGTESEIFPVKRETFDPTATTRARGNTVGSYDMPSTAELKIQASSSRNNSLPRHSPGRYQPQIEDAVRVRGLGSARTPCRIESDDAPERTSSMRKSSMDSTSATSQGSNPFRPHSRHTANTSVDMSPLSKDTNLSYVSLGAAPHRASPENRFRSSLATESMPSLDGSLHKPKLSTAFNIDDYISSDDDPEAPRHSRGEGEEHLLFRDTGFAFDGRGLPGISGSIDNATPRFVPASPPRRTAGDFRPINNRDLDDMMLETYRPARAEPRYNSLPSRPRRQMAAYRYEDSDPSDPEESQGLSGEPDDDLSFDIPMTRRPTPAQSYRPGRYASREQVIEEEREYDKVDLSTAMKLRKEEKRKKRLSGASGSTIRAYSNGGMPRSHKYDVAGLDADAE